MNKPSENSYKLSGKILRLIESPESELPQLVALLESNRHEIEAPLKARIAELEKERDCWIENAKNLQNDYNKREKVWNESKSRIATLEAALEKAEKVIHCPYQFLPDDRGNKCECQKCQTLTDIREAKGKQ